MLQLVLLNSQSEYFFPGAIWKSRFNSIFMPHKKHFAKALHIIVALCIFSFGAHAESLSSAVQAYVGTPLTEVGSSNFRKYGFRVYRAILWAPGGVWSDTKPSALEFRYQRSLSKDTLSEGLIDDISAQKIADEPTIDKWAEWLDKTLPSVKDGDTIIGVRKPGSAAVLFFNGRKLATIHDPLLEQAFFNIWLGNHADEDMRTALLNIGDK